jgi:hypothetical protein
MITSPLSTVSVVFGGGATKKENQQRGEVIRSKS